MGIVWSAGLYIHTILCFFFSKHWKTAAASEMRTMARGFCWMIGGFLRIRVQAGRKTGGLVFFRSVDGWRAVSWLWRGLRAGLKLLFDPVKRQRFGGQFAAALRAEGDVEPGQAQDFFRRRFPLPSLHPLRAEAACRAMRV